MPGNRSAGTEESNVMLMMRRASAAAAVAVLVVAMASGACDAAKSRSKARATVRPIYVAPGAGMSKVYVPAHILKGSALTKGRVFYRTNLQENTLAGITLARGATSILAKWGNPSRITVGSAQAEVATTTPALPAGPAYIPPAGGGGFPDITAAFNPDTELGGYRPSLPPLPGLSRIGMPGMLPGAQPRTGPTTGGGETRALRQEEVTWTYDLPNGITLEFIVTDGIITQITVGGEGPWGLSKTRTGLQLGDTYKLVLWVCGYPTEPQKYVGRFLRVSYIDKNRCLFTFLNKKLVGVTIALVQQELQEGAGQR